MNLNENIKIIERKDIDNYNYMKVKNYIQSKDPIQIEIYIPNLITKNKKEIQKIRRILKLTAGDTCKVEIEMQILTVPIQLLFSCENYELEFKNDSYYLKTNQLLSKEKLTFKIENYIKGDNNKLKVRIDSLEGNTSKEPKINVEENSFIVEMPNVNDNDVKRINCNIECFISQNYKIPIKIDSAILPINYSFQIYDYSNRTFTSNKLNLLLPTGRYENNDYNFVKYFNNTEINLHLLICVPFRKKNIKAIIKTKPNIYYTTPIKFEFDEKEIEINNEKTEINCKINIDFGNIISNEIGSLECDIEGKIQKIIIEKKDFNCEYYNNTILNEIEIFKYSKNIENDSYEWIPIKNTYDITNKELYICPFGFWNNKIIKFNKKYYKNYYDNYYYQIEPKPKNIKILFISQEGKIVENNNKFYEYNEEGYLYGSTNYYPLLCYIEEEWYPLITEYEEEDLFNLPECNFQILKNKYNSLYKGQNGNYDTLFYKFLNEYPFTYEDLKSKRQLFFSQYNRDYKNNNPDNYLKNIINCMNENKTLDIIYRIINKKKYSFSFSYLAYLIFEKPDNTLKSFNKFFPDSIKKIIQEQINYILEN